MGSFHRMVVNVNLNTDIAENMLSFLSQFNLPFVEDVLLIKPIYGFQPLIDQHYHITPRVAPVAFINVSYYPGWNVASFTKLPNRTYQLEIKLASKFIDENDMYVMLDWLSPHFSDKTPRYFCLVAYEDGETPYIFEWDNSKINTYCLDLPEPPEDTDWDGYAMTLPDTTDKVTELVTNNERLLVGIVDRYLF